jgi:hypothetical protein
MQGGHMGKSPRVFQMSSSFAWQRRGIRRGLGLPALCRICVGFSMSSPTIPSVRRKGIPPTVLRRFDNGGSFRTLCPERSAVMGFTAEAAVRRMLWCLNVRASLWPR